MIRPFRVTVTGTVTNPVSPQKLIAVSTSASDTQNLTITGRIAGPTNVTETRPLLGQVEVEFATNTFVAVTGILLASTAVGIVTVYAQGQKAVGYIRVDTLPTNNKILRVGLNGFTRTYTFKTVLTGGANEIAIGADIYVAARNIRRALDAATGSGSSYGTGTVANAYVDGFSDSLFATPDLDGTTQNQLYIRDVLATSRLLAWDLYSDDTALTLAAPTGGGLGAVITQVTTGGTQNYNSMSLFSPAGTTGTLLANSIVTSDVIRVGGRPVSVRIATGTLSANIGVTLEASDDAGANWYAKVSLVMHTSEEQILDYTADLVEDFRLVVTSNTNTTDAPLHAVVIGQ